jgi:hypothetical protein
VHGTRDPFGSPEELKAAAALIAAPVLHTFVERAGHDLFHGSFDVVTMVLEPLRTLV